MSYMAIPTRTFFLKSLHIPIWMEIMYSKAYDFHEKIYYGNFEQCPKLKSILFAGSEAQWKTIKSSSAIPSGVSIEHNTAF